MHSNRIGVALCIIAGSFFLYCGQSALNPAHDGGPVGDANGQSSGGGGTCCTPPPRETPTVIFDDVVKDTPIPNSSTLCTRISPVFDVSGYRSVVVHAPTCSYWVQVRNGKAGFVLGPDAACDTGSNNSLSIPRATVIDTSIGHELRINFAAPSAANPDGDEGCGGTPIALTVVGFRNP